MRLFCYNLQNHFFFSGTASIIKVYALFKDFSSSLCTDPL